MCSVRSGSHNSSIRIFLVVEGVLHARRRLRAVRHRDHHRRRRVTRLCPALLRLAASPCPAGSSRCVTRSGSGSCSSALRFKIVLDLRVVVDVVEPRFVVFASGIAVVAHDDARRFHQPRLDRVVQPEVADDPAEQRFLAALLARRRERASPRSRSRSECRAPRGSGPARRSTCVASSTSSLVTPLTFDSAGTRQAWCASSLITSMIAGRWPSRPAPRGRNASSLFAPRLSTLRFFLICSSLSQFRACQLRTSTFGPAAVCPAGPAGRC